MSLTGEFVHHSDRDAQTGVMFYKIAIYTKWVISIYGLVLVHKHAIKKIVGKSSLW